jgi:hypothetical protein
MSRQKLKRQGASEQQSHPSSPGTRAKFHSYLFNSNLFLLWTANPSPGAMPTAPRRHVAAHTLDPQSSILNLTPMPRKPILDDPKKEIACALARAGMTGRWIAAFFGVDESTLRYALTHDESFRMRYDQAKALMMLDHLTHIAKAASKSWRASMWLLKFAFPNECNLRHRTSDDAFDGEPSNPNKPDAQAKADAATTNDDPHQPEPPASADFPPSHPCPPAPGLDLRPFETTNLLKELSFIGYRAPTTFGLQPDNSVLSFGEIPPPRNDDPVRRRIYEENLTGFQIDQAIEEQYAKERQAQAIAAQYATMHACTAGSPTTATG